MADCPLCLPQGETVLYRQAQYRVILATDEMGQAYPGFCRVIWHAHVKEMTDLPPADQQTVFKVLLATEAAVRDVLCPDKVNLASFGNMVPHLHWHVIPRWQADAAFPGSVWSPPLRPGVASLANPEAVAAQLAAALALRLDDDA